MDSAKKKALACGGAIVGYWPVLFAAVKAIGGEDLKIREACGAAWREGDMGTIFLVVGAFGTLIVLIGFLIDAWVGKVFAGREHDALVKELERSAGAAAEKRDARMKELEDALNVQAARHAADTAARVEAMEASRESAGREARAQRAALMRASLWFLHRLGVRLAGANVVVEAESAEFASMVGGNMLFSSADAADHMRVIMENTRELAPELESSLTTSARARDAQGILENDD